MDGLIVRELNGCALSRPPFSLFVEKVISFKTMIFVEREFLKNNFFF
jgi:hypothetical protein